MDLAVTLPEASVKRFKVPPDTTLISCAAPFACERLFLTVTALLAPLRVKAASVLPTASSPKLRPTLPISESSIKSAEKSAFLADKVTATLVFVPVTSKPVSTILPDVPSNRPSLTKSIFASYSNG